MKFGINSAILSKQDLKMSLFKMKKYIKAKIKPS